MRFARPPRPLSWPLAAAWVAAAFVVSTWPAAVAADQGLSTVEVLVWQPPFNHDRLRAPAAYRGLEKATGEWRICVSIPHLKDTYWLAVNYALVDQAKRLGVALRLHEAGGYGNLAAQRQRIEECMASGGQGLLVSAISRDGLNDLLERFTSSSVPVVDLINGVSASGLTGRVAADFWDHGYEAARYLGTLKESLGRAPRVAWFPGPEGAGWSTAGNAGFLAAASQIGLDVVDTRWGDTGRAVQAALLNAALDAHGPLDAVVGTAVTAAVAGNVLRERGLSKPPVVVAYYYGPGVHRAIRRGLVRAGLTDRPALLARLGLDVMVRALEGKPHPRHLAPPVMLVDQSNIRAFDATTSLPPRGFRPVFSIGHWE